ncbi:MAG: prephenate dehydratase [Chitinophagaceae bacterium]|nr:prephenate dehydratase [Chitinophagaceae bacterium]
MKKKIAIQGYEGSFHQLAGIEYFGEDFEPICCASFKEVVNQVKNNPDCYGGVMAIENSIAGSILPNYNLISRSGLQIPGEIYLQIDQNLLVNPGVRLEDIHEVHSHHMALLQCADFLETRPWRLIETEDTALSAYHVHKTKTGCIAAIAGAFAAEKFNLEILKGNIQTEKNNYTRFWILQKELHLNKDADKASMVFQTDHSKGSLARVLTKISDCGVNLSKLQSMPIPGSDWLYAFHADCEFADLAQWESLLEAIKPFIADVLVYGVYRNGKLHKNCDLNNA